MRRLLRNDLKGRSCAQAFAPSDAAALAEIGQVSVGRARGGRPGAVGRALLAHQGGGVRRRRGHYPHLEEGQGPLHVAAAETRPRPHLSDPHNGRRRRRQDGGIPVLSIEQAA
eukprot:scaffold250_cov110-Isochrysis_galbana.AAC.21